MALQLFRSGNQNSPLLKIPAIGVELTVRLPPQASGNALTIIETVNAPGFGPPLHSHAEAEVFRVLEGRYLYQVNGQRFEAHAGEVVSIPGRAEHAFLNIDDNPSRQLVMMLPGMDAEKFFLGLGNIMAGGRPSQDALNAFGEPWGVEFLGPPLSLSAR